MGKVFLFCVPTTQKPLMTNQEALHAPGWRVTRENIEERCQLTMQYYLLLFKIYVNSQKISR